jgi:pimeloyl-ACP methyl ester carboxylesterase
MAFNGVRSGQSYRIPAAFLLSLFLLFSAWVSPRAAEQYPLPEQIDLNLPPGRMVDIGGYKLHLWCRGQGIPTVILDAGLGGFSLDWMFVQAQLQAETTVCAYDRAGYGWSDPGPPPRDSEQLAEELALLLEKSSLPGPYLLVGHSFGGYNMQYYAKLYPDSVSGIVLVDASHPEQSDRLPGAPGEQRAPVSDRLVTFFNPAVVRKYYPEPMWFPVSALMSSGKAMIAQQRELTNFVISGAEVKQAGALPDVPLVVVSRGQRVWPETPLGDSLEQTWRELQKDLTAGTRCSRQVIAEHSGHLIHLDEPGVVAAAVRSVMHDHCVAPLARRAKPDCDMQASC